MKTFMTSSDVSGEPVTEQTMGDTSFKFKGRNLEIPSPKKFRGGLQSRGASIYNSRFE